MPNHRHRAARRSSRIRKYHGKLRPDRGNACDISVPTSPVTLATGPLTAPSLSGQLGAVTVTDNHSADPAAWTASVSATPFQNGTHTLPAASYDTGVVTSTGIPISQWTITTPLTLSTTPQNPVVLNPTWPGGGNNTATWNPTITVAIPPVRYPEPTLRSSPTRSSDGATSTVRRVLTTLAVLVAGMLIPATSALTVPALAADPKPGSIGIRLLDAPTNEQDNPRARIYIIDYLPLGTVIHRHIEVTNKSNSEARLTVYPSAASVENGTFSVAPGHTPNDLTTWISLDHETLILPPGASAPVTATIAVPRDASPGERYAGIWAETTTPALHDKGVAEVNRVGIRVYLDVGPGGPPAPNFVINSLTPKRLPDGRPALTAQVHNTGGRALDMSGELTLTEGPGGLNTRPFPAKLGTTLAPGQSEPVTVILDSQLPDGPWKALIHLKSGLTEHSAQATVIFPHNAGAATPVKTTSTANKSYLIGAIIIALVLLTALAFTILRRNHRAHRTQTTAEP